MMLMIIRAAQVYQNFKGGSLEDNVTDGEDGNNAVNDDDAVNGDDVEMMMMP